MWKDAFYFHESSNLHNENIFFQQNLLKIYIFKNIADRCVDGEGLR